MIKIGRNEQEINMQQPIQHDRSTAPADKPGLLAPDTSGMNFYRADPALTDLLRLHLPEPLFRHIEPHLDRLGGPGGGPPRRMRRARRSSPASAAPARPVWPRFANHRVPSGLSRAGE